MGQNIPATSGKLTNMPQDFDQLDQLPGGFFDCTTATIRSVFPRPTLIHLRGKGPRLLFISILLHGNESTGLDVMQQILATYPELDQLPCSIMLFVGNVFAAESDCRFLDDQIDFNRCWPGTELGESATSRMMQQVFDIATAQALFVAIDIHNNTGKNPHYACITDVTDENRSLAARFNRVALVFDKVGVSTRAFNGICPAITLECGKPGEASGIRHCRRFIEEILVLDELPAERPPRDRQHLVESHATLNIPDNVSFEFDPDADSDLRFESNFEIHNFTPLDPEQVFAYSRIARPLAITDQNGHDVTDELVRIEQGKVYLNNTLMPAMITQDKKIVRQDCLCYLLQDYLEHSNHDNL
ncbi:MAG: succinylglutamate desuccinylase [Planctomycetota bacterium]